MTKKTDAIVSFFSRLKKKHTKIEKRLRPLEEVRPISLKRYESTIKSLQAPPNIATNLDRPLLSIILVIYKMRRQAENTLYSLSSAYQLGVTNNQYEVIVVENESDDLFDGRAIKKYGNNFHYFFREEKQPTPVNAANFGASKAKGQSVCIMIDGARLITPGMIQYTLLAQNFSQKAIVSVPGYHLGSELQQHAVKNGYDENQEKMLLEKIQWPNDGYRLFDISVFSASCGGGYFKPISESNCLTLPRSIWDKIGGLNTSFTTKGGGLVNLDLYKRALEYPDCDLFLLPGEGTFHQFHGGATTDDSDDKRKKQMLEHLNQYYDIRNAAYQNPARRPIMLGKILDNALPFIRHSAKTPHQPDNNSCNKVK